MKLDKNKRLALFITIMTVLVLAGITYTFFSASVSNENNEKLITQTATMSLKFDDNDNGVSGSLNLGQSITKKFTLENTGTVDSYARIKWYDLVNTYTTDSLSWTLEQSETENGSKTLMGSGNVPISSSPSIKPLVNNLLVPANKTYYYKLTITLNNLDINQSSDINATMHSKFSLSTEIDTAVAAIQKLAAGKSIKDNADIIDSNEYAEYETKNRYKIGFDGFFLPTEWEYETDDLEFCEEDLEDILNEENRSTVTGKCEIDPSTGKYNINMNVIYYFKTQEECESRRNSDWILENATCESIEIKVPINSSNECTNTLAYDGTSDNNLRYVGANPCNYVTFNGESPTTTSGWIIANSETGIQGSNDIYESQEACQTGYQGYGSPAGWECVENSIATGGWRIVGVMNNIDDGTGNKETRIKLVRSDSLGRYSWDTSSSSDVNSRYGYGYNDWTHAALMQELNGDYLDTTLTENTMWYSRYNYEVEYDYTKGLSNSAQALIDNAKWYLGGVDGGKAYDKGTASYFYEHERGNEVWGSTSGQNCNDSHCPRTLDWTGKVALLYPSDYGYATGSADRIFCLSTSLWYFDSYDLGCLNNWLIPREGIREEIDLFLTPMSDSNSSVYTLSYWGTLYDLDPDYNQDVHPAVYLKSSVQITSGDGSAENPYVFG